jgi:hypothetical protein
VVEQILDGTESGDAVVNDCTLNPLVSELREQFKDYCWPDT